MAIANKLTSLPRYLYSNTASNLNLLCTIEQNIIDTIQGLPEIKQAYETSTAKSSITTLQRGCQVMENVMKGSKEHVSSLKFLADLQNYHGLYGDSSNTIRVIRSLTQDNEGKALLLAQAKSEFNHGNFNESLRLGKEMQHVSSEHLDVGCSLTAIALSKLMIYLCNVHEMDELDTKEETIIIQDFNDAVESLQNIEQDDFSRQGILASSGASHNLYIASYALSNLYTNQNISIPDHITATTDISAQLSNTIKDLTTNSFNDTIHPYYHYLHQSTLASLYCTQSHDKLFHTKSITQEELQTTSKACQEALHICEALKKENIEDPLIFSRSLFLVAQCFAKANSAITSEGLFNSCIDLLKNQPNSPYRDLVLRDVYSGNAELYRNWERRERDAEKFDILAKDLEGGMVDEWKFKDGILSGLWFFTLSDFYL